MAVMQIKSVSCIHMYRPINGVTYRKSYGYAYNYTYAYGVSGTFLHPYSNVLYTAVCKAVPLNVGNSKTDHTET